MQNQRTIFWLGFICLLGYFVYLVSDIMFPFITAIIIAYFLNPLVMKLEHLNIPRKFSAFLLSLLFVLIVTVILFKLLPVVTNQISQFIKLVPKYKEFLITHVTSLADKFLGQVDHSIHDTISNIIQNLSSVVLRYLGSIISNAWSSGLALINILSLIIITPIITFYMLRDWKILVHKLDSWLPITSRAAIKHQIFLIDSVLSNFIRGQTNICIIFALFYSAALSVLGLNFSLFIGIMTGVLGFVPYIGIIIGTLSAVIVALFQFQDIKHIVIVCIIFLSGQLIESNFLTPKLIGEKIGLHPVWLFFVMFAGGSLFGFVGILFAVPVGAIIGVIIRAVLKLYLSSVYYR